MLTKIGLSRLEKLALLLGGDFLCLAALKPLNYENQSQQRDFSFYPKGKEKKRKESD